MFNNARKGLRAWVRYDGNDNAVAGSLIFQKDKPKVGKWKEYVDVNLCCTTSTTSNVNPTWTFVPDAELQFPTSQTGYTLYTGGWTNYDDGQTTDPIPYAGTFYTDGVGDTEYKLSTNGFLFGIINSLYIYGNGQDLFLTPGDPLDNGDTQNFWYKNDVYPTKWKTSVLVYCGHCCGTPNQQTPYSYILNLYQDATTQYVETRVEAYDGGDAGPNGPSAGSSNIQSQVWSSVDNGISWNYLGFGAVV